jgi:hypothetical protein
MTLELNWVGGTWQVRAQSVDGNASVILLRCLTLVDSNWLFDTPSV